MDREPASVWVTRPRPGNEITASFLRAHGLPVLAVPVLEVESVPFRLPAGSLPDWIVFVSANAVRGLESGPERTLARAKAAARAACVGRKTAELARKVGWRVDLVPGTESARGLAREIVPARWRSRRVWIPAGDREGSARTLLPDALRGAGATVQVFGVYRTAARSLTANERSALAGALPGASVFHSPSAVDAVFGPGAPAEILAWRDAAAVAVGPTTALRLEAAGAPRIVTAGDPSDRGVLAALGG